MSSIPAKKLFVFGLGYSASRAAHAFHSIGYQVSGTVRSVDSAMQLSQSNSELFRFESSTTHSQSVFLFDGDTWSATNSLSLERALNGVTHVLVSVPTGCPGGQADPVLAALREPLIRATKDSIQWVGYLSTIGVYGETNGVKVDESAPVGSSVGRSQMRIKAERLWLDSGLPTHVFRIAGIYGPSRGTLTKVRSGTASMIHIPGRKFNRIHVDDIVNILLASAAQPNPGGIYNMCDDEPAPSDEVTAYACELLGVQVPPRQSWEEAEKTMSAMAKSFYAEGKICANRRIKEELGVQLIYPTYREGFLAQVLEEDKLTTGDVRSYQAASNTLPRLVVLVNIGSLRAEPYLDLRQISFQLSRSIGQPVVPCSFRFSNRVDPNELNGLQAKTFGMVLTDHLATRGDNASDVVVLPLFFGKSNTLTEYLPKTISKVWAAATPTPLTPLTVRVGGCLVDQENADDTRVAQILLQRIQAVVDLKTVADDVNVLVVDHGTPSRDVNESRELVAQALRGLLQRYEHVKLVDTACMERREGAKYDFNDPLLAQALDHYTVKTGIVVCAIMFLSNGRHAGEKGDIEEIIEDVRARHPGVNVRVTEALGAHELLSEIMQDRYSTALAKKTPDYTLSNDK
ncbi:unnamed protein product [Peronospora destructor]|uniref:NAD-dependent epimerase/dehydratase domain-containing protein n=1 Tax=Peronospora destructor TaxID=86335 RepID=A0AAV0VA49_9STRA|nr:unnamed protein product [Peronospora destructor]